MKTKLAVLALVVWPCSAYFLAAFATWDFGWISQVAKADPLVRLLGFAIFCTGFPLIYECAKLVPILNRERDVRDAP